MKMFSRTKSIGLAMYVAYTAVSFLSDNPNNPFK